MRKVLGSISLLVLLLNTLLTPITYAGEYEEILETSSENVTEEVVEENGEGRDSSEFSVEEEIPDEENEEEKTEEEVIETEETEEDETTTGDVVEEGTGDTKEIETEELTGEVEDLTGEIAETITGTQIEELTGSAEETTGGVVEDEIGTGESEEIEYNKESIIGERTYNDVTVKVEALSGIFPEGTELKIEPIRWWTLSNLKDKLVEEQEEVNEDTTVVAFDITFIYSGEEVQPKEGEKVKVTFDYSKNEELVEADKQENQEVKVYHIEDKNEEGNELEKGEEKIEKIEINEIESKELDNGLVIDAENFSVYVLALSNDDSIKLTLNPGNGGSILNGGNITVDENGIGTINDVDGAVILPGATKENSNFMGWYDDNNEIKGVSGDSYTILSNTTLYAKWEDVLDTSSTYFPEVFSQKGACIFNGAYGTITGDECTKYYGKKFINTEIQLYKTENHDKDYEIGFTIDHYNPNEQDIGLDNNQQTLMNTKNEASGYPGIVFRKSSTDLALNSRRTNSANSEYKKPYTNFETVKIYRIKNKITNNREIYYSINGAGKKFLNNLSEYNPTFNLSVWFGAAPQSNSLTAAQRFLNGTLSNMYIKLGTYMSKVTWNYIDSEGNDVSETTEVEFNGTGKLDNTPPDYQTIDKNCTFVGWKKDGNEVNITNNKIIDDTTYDAYYSCNPRKYTIVFEDENGTEISSEEYDYGTVSGDIVKPTAPEKPSDGTYTYEFTGWYPEVETVTTGARYRATYTPTYIKYLVSFKGPTGTIIATGYYHSGDTPTAPAAPQKEPTAQYTYEFAGWNPAVSVVTGNITYEPIYDETLRTYTITWNNDNGELINTTQVEYGQIPTHADASKENTDEYTYTFSGWTPEIKSVTGPATYQAVFTATKNKYAITWKNEDGSTIDTTEVEYGVVPTHADASKENTDEWTYTFSGWTPEPTAVEGEATYQAVFTSTKNSYTIKFKNEDGTTLQTTDVLYGETPVYNGSTPTKASTQQHTYTFAGWDPAIADVTGPAEYTAKFTEHPRMYTITWNNDNGELINTTEVAYGVVPTHADASKANTDEWTYTFSGWTPEPIAVEGPATYQAVFTATKNKYAITWKNEDGSTIDTTEVEYGVVPTHADATKANTAEYTYTFSGWYPEPVAVTQAAEYTAVFTATVNTYTITWNNWDGTLLGTDKDVPYGTHIGYTGSTPTSGSTAQYTYEFKEFIPIVHDVTGPQVYTATYTSTVNKYQIRFLDENGTELQSTPVPYGTVPSYTGPTPTKEGYTFKSWNPTPVAVNGATDYTATYTVNNYNVTPVKGVGVANILGGGSYPYNTVVTLTGIAKEGYHFEGGVSEKAFTYTVPSHNITPQIDAEPNTYHVHFKPNGGTGVMANQEFVYDVEQELLPNAYTRSGFTFISWTDGEGGYYTDKKKVKNLATTGSVILLAQWFEGDGPTPGPTPTPTPSGGGSSGGGGRRPIDKDTQEHASAAESGDIKEIEGTQAQTGTTAQTGATKTGTTIQWTEEELTVYQYAYKHGITTLAPKEAARPDEYVQRGHMAKMVVNYALNVLNRKLPTKMPKQCKWKDGRNAWESEEIKEYAEKACALGLMGIDMEYFQPYKLVTRAQFGTIFGRLLWGKIVSKPYYAGHLARLRKRGIMTQIDRPEERIEIRKWAWLMFMRSEKYFKIDK